MITQSSSSNTLNNITRNGDSLTELSELPLLHKPQTPPLSDDSININSDLQPTSPSAASSLHLFTPMQACNPNQRLLTEGLSSSIAHALQKHLDNIAPIFREVLSTIRTLLRASSNQSPLEDRELQDQINTASRGLRDTLPKLLNDFFLTLPAQSTAAHAYTSLWAYQNSLIFNEAFHTFPASSFEITGEANTLQDRLIYTPGLTPAELDANTLINLFETASKLIYGTTAPVTEITQAIPQHPSLFQTYTYLESLTTLIHSHPDLFACPPPTNNTNNTQTAGASIKAWITNAPLQAIYEELSNQALTNIISSLASTLFDQHLTSRLPEIIDQSHGIYCSAINQLTHELQCYMHTAHLSFIQSQLDDNNSANKLQTLFDVPTSASSLKEAEQALKKVSSAFIKVARHALQQHLLQQNPQQTSTNTHADTLTKKIENHIATLEKSTHDLQNMIKVIEKRGSALTGGEEDIASVQEVQKIVTTLIRSSRHIGLMLLKKSDEEIERCLTLTDDPMLNNLLPKESAIFPY